ncbi:MAG: type III secretion chaperone [Chlamydiae bacterium RIFCSPHIGHO2_12_FULL_44_59]|nr:MAG: type III secretion chaperone [Chlamydiae bacterium RIFCSPHIGHO2_01_FULL_44_39]OGN59483.1 MAG: type III secretion chaperone [Chlamydiae bacterium RIFCSPHIGHO2_12_FULL_44_59]OGN67236.1 MAG: type III secretion chaperone [Chlamydiae bacterium RIFCSPLOWO2_01_FULL_44_52]OGN67433.1 MAG: type III secretion chaperone [Chlamydiae bacterium RIFCSPLOWO2_02_FULL_45_22]OGN69165.1 MAG: type III secretion chaperone [Chlamydiae bacterium RIFCSPLOWO2_12_FULL_45_20]
MDWQEVLGWGETELNDLRFVGYAYIRQGIYDVALTFFNALSVLTHPTAYDLQTMGALHLQLGNGLKALDYLDRALKADPSHLATQLNRAKALFMLGYKRQGLLQAEFLEDNADKAIAEKAAALTLSYR